MKLHIQGVSKTYSNGVQALKDVTLTIPVGMYGLIDEDVALSTYDGTTVADIVTDSQSTDPDGDTLGIAITAAGNSDGDGEFSTNNGASWNSVGSVSATSALVLADTRYPPIPLA